MEHFPAYALRVQMEIVFRTLARWKVILRRYDNFDQGVYMIPEVHLPGEWAEWKITELIGSGSYGTVYKAERKLDDQVIVSAVKVISVPSSEESDMSVLDLMHGDKEKTYEYYYGVVRDFEREIRAMNSLKGITNIVSIEDYYIEKQNSRIGWNIYLRMEYLTCFSNFWSNHLLKEDDAISLGIDISTALSYCEKAQIIHRDVKPENIFVTQYGNYKLGDFGIARKLDQTLGTYTLRGTYRYMAPEIFHNNRYGTTVDQYSLGLVLYSMMNGNRMPFLNEGQQLYTYKDRQKALQRRMDGDQLPPPSDASPEFAKIILRACEYRPEDRYPSIEQMQEDLEELRRERRLAGRAAKADSADSSSGSVVPNQAESAENQGGSVSGAAEGENGSVPEAAGSLDGSIPKASGSLNGSVSGAAGGLNGSVSGASGGLNGSMPEASGNLAYGGSLQRNMPGSMVPQSNGVMGYGQGQSSFRSVYGGGRLANSDYAYGRNSASPSYGSFAGTGQGARMYRRTSSLRQGYLQTPGGIQVAVQNPASQVRWVRRESAYFRNFDGASWDLEGVRGSAAAIKDPGAIRNPGAAIKDAGAYAEQGAGVKDTEAFPKRRAADHDSAARLKQNQDHSVLRQNRKGGKSSDSVKGGIRSLFGKKNKPTRSQLDSLPKSTRSVEKKRRSSLSKYSFGELIAIIVALLMIAAALLLVLYQPAETKPEKVVPEAIERDESGTEAGRREEGGPRADGQRADEPGADNPGANSLKADGQEANNPGANSLKADGQGANNPEVNSLG